jgi:hypothetical protein
MNKNKNYLRILQGQAGNYRVASELLLRGYNVYFPAADTGVDILVEGCVRVQVKSAHLTRTNHSPDNWRAHYSSLASLYGFRLSGMRHMKGTRTVKATPRDFTKECDFLVLWGIEENRFWVIPSALITRRCTVVLGSIPERDLWRLRQDSNMQRMRNCEGKWDLIAGSIATLTEATSEVAHPVVVAEGVQK